MSCSFDDGELLRDPPENAAVDVADIVSGFRELLGGHRGTGAGATEHQQRAGAIELAGSLSELSEGNEAGRMDVSLAVLGGLTDIDDLDVVSPLQHG